MLLEQLKCERLVVLRECAIADHVREHDRSKLAILGAALGHIAGTLCTSLPERRLQGKGSLYQLSYAQLPHDDGTFQEAKEAVAGPGQLIGTSENRLVAMRAQLSRRPELQVRSFALAADGRESPKLLNRDKPALTQPSRFTAWRLFVLLYETLGNHRRQSQQSRMEFGLGFSGGL
jgi:hypothetical protein